jgi:hypothetical protein
MDDFRTDLVTFLENNTFAEWIVELKNAVRTEKESQLTPYVNFDLPNLVKYLQMNKKVFNKSTIGYILTSIITKYDIMKNKNQPKGTKIGGVKKKDVDHILTLKHELEKDDETSVVLKTIEKNVLNYCTSLCDVF